MWLPQVENIPSSSRPRLGEQGDSVTIGSLQEGVPVIRGLITGKRDPGGGCTPRSTGGSGRFRAGLHGTGDGPPEARSFWGLRLEGAEGPEGGGGAMWKVRGRHDGGGFCLCLGGVTQQCAGESLGPELQRASVAWGLKTARACLIDGRHRLKLGSVGYASRFLNDPKICLSGLFKIIGYAQI